MSTAPRLASIVFIVALATSGCAWIARASVDSAGNQAGGGDSVFAAVSGDGRYVAFSSDATNLVAGDTNGVRDVFLRDNATGVTSRVSVDSAANQAIGDGDGRGSYLPAISTNGRFVAFTSFAANLVLGDTNGWPDVFVHDTTTGATTRVSVDSAGIQGAGPSGAAWGTLEWMAADISGDGRYVSFTSAAGNLVADDTNAILDVFVHDTTAGVTTRVSVDSAGNQAACAGLDLTCLQTGSYGAAISDDGGHVAYQSWTINLVAGDTNAADDVFVHDTTTGTTTRVSVDSTGGQSVGGGGSQAMQAISADGTRVAFASSATNLVAGDTNTQPDVFVHDTTTGATSRVSVDSAGAQSDGSSDDVSLSADGARVAFASSATNLVAGDTNTQPDVFVHDTTTGTTSRVSVDSAGAQSGGTGTSPSLSADGRYVGFTSGATTLVGNDTNAVDDVFVRAVAAPAVDTVTPSSLTRSTTTTVTLTGTGFGPGVTVATFVTNPNGVTVDSITVVSDTELELTVTVDTEAATGTRNLFVTVPGPGPGDQGMFDSLGNCSGCLTVT